MNPDILKIVSAAPAIVSALWKVFEAEKTRSRLTTPEVFERAGHTLDENEQKLLDDLAALHAPTP